MKRTRLSLLLAAVMALGSAPGFGQASSSSAASAASVLPDGYPIEFATGRTVCSESDNPGELVEFIVKHNVIAGNEVLLAEGTSVYGKVVASRLTNRASGEPGMLEFRLETVKLTNGQDIPLRTIRTLPTEAKADLTPEKLTNLVNSPYGPFAHFTSLPIVTVPKNTLVTLYVAADVTVGNQMVVAPYAPSQSDSLASHIVHSTSGAKSLGEIAREQREHGKISGGMVSGTQ